MINYDNLLKFVEPYYKVDSDILTYATYFYI